MATIILPDIFYNPYTWVMIIFIILLMFHLLESKHHRHNRYHKYYNNNSEYDYNPHSIQDSHDSYDSQYSYGDMAGIADVNISGNNYKVLGRNIGEIELYCPNTNDGSMCSSVSHEDKKIMQMQMMNACYTNIIDDIIDINNRPTNLYITP